MGRRKVRAFSWAEDVLEEIDARAGANVSVYTEGLVRAGLQAVGGGSPLLRDAKVQHAASFHETTYRITLGPTLVHVNRKVAADLDDPGHGAPFTVRHEAEVPRGADWLSGEHYINPVSCFGCRELLGAYPRRARP